MFQRDYPLSPDSRENIYFAKKLFAFHDFFKTLNRDCYVELFVMSYLFLLISYENQSSLPFRLSHASAWI